MLPVLGKYKLEVPLFILLILVVVDSNGVHGGEGNQSSCQRPTTPPLETSSSGLSLLQSLSLTSRTALSSMLQTTFQSKSRQHDSNEVTSEDMKNTQPDGTRSDVSIALVASKDIQASGEGTLYARFEHLLEQMRIWSFGTSSLSRANVGLIAGLCVFFALAICCVFVVCLVIRRQGNSTVPPSDPPLIPKDSLALGGMATACRVKHDGGKYQAKETVTQSSITPTFAPSDFAANRRQDDTTASQADALPSPSADKFCPELKVDPKHECVLTVPVQPPDASCFICDSNGEPVLEATVISKADAPWQLALKALDGEKALAFCSELRSGDSKGKAGDRVAAFEVSDSNQEYFASLIDLGDAGFDFVAMRTPSESRRFRHRIFRNPEAPEDSLAFKFADYRGKLLAATEKQTPENDATGPFYRLRVGPGANVGHHVCAWFCIGMFRERQRQKDNITEPKGQAAARQEDTTIGNAIPESTLAGSESAKGAESVERTQHPEEWKLDNTLLLCSTGEEACFHGKANLLSDFASVSEVVSKLNEEPNLCPEGFCVVHSTQQGKYFVVYKEEKKTEVLRLFNSKTWKLENTAILCNSGEETCFQGKAKLLSDLTSVSEAVRKLNEEPNLCPEGFCVVHSTQQGKYFVVYKLEKKTEVFRLFNLSAASSPDIIQSRQEDTTTEHAIQRSTLAGSQSVDVTESMAFSEAFSPKRSQETDAEKMAREAQEEFRAARRDVWANKDSPR